MLGGQPWQGLNATEMRSTQLNLNLNQEVDMGEQNPEIICTGYDGNKKSN